MITIRMPEDIFQTDGEIENGTFHGRWHFSFGEYYDPENTGFGPLRVFNDDTLSPGAVWPLHPHKDIEVVTYCADGEFRHADQRGEGGILRKGWVQHTTVGSGMYHSEINNRKDKPMRFIQMWFMPEGLELKPSAEQKAVDKNDRTDRLLPLVSNEDEGALRIRQDAKVYSCFLEYGHLISYRILPGHGVYLYVLEGGPIEVNGHEVPVFGATKIKQEPDINIKALENAELLLVDVGCV
ncbi:MAG: pirin family protein [Caulobacteraceae bacterium]